MTRAAQALLARSLGIQAGTALPAYVQGRATELDVFLQDCRLPAGHPVVQAHAAGIASDWRAQEAASAQGTAALALYGAIGKPAPSPSPGSPRSVQSRAVWNILSTAMTGRPGAETLPAAVLARAGELDLLLREGRLPADHPIVRAHAARIVSDCRVLEAAGLALQATEMLRGWLREAGRRQASLDRREQTVEDREAALARRQEALDAQEAALTERTRVLDAREASLELRERQATEQPSQNRWTRIWTRFTAWFWS